MRVPQALLRLDAPVVRQFVKYGIVGASNTILTFVDLHGLGRGSASTTCSRCSIGYLVGSLNSYVLNRRWTFGAGHLAHSDRRARASRSCRCCAIAANLALLYLFVHHLGSREDRRAGDPDGAGAGRHLLRQPRLVVRATDRRHRAAGRAHRRAGGARPRERRWWLAIALVTGVAAVLRLIALGLVPRQRSTTTRRCAR